MTTNQRVISECKQWNISDVVETDVILVWTGCEGNRFQCGTKCFLDWDTEFVNL